MWGQRRERRDHTGALLTPCYPQTMAESFDAGTKETVKKLPLLTINAGPRDKDTWGDRLKQVGTRCMRGGPG